MLSAATEKTFSSQIELTTGTITLRDSFDLPENTVHIRREQLLASEIFFDRMTFENFNLTPVDFTVELLFDADFVDVFQVRGVARQQHGQYYRPIVSDRGIAFYYRGLDGIMRQTLIKLSPRPTQIQDRVARWELRLEPLKRVELEASVTPMVEGQSSRAQVYDLDHHLRQRRANFARWESSSTSFQTDNDVLEGLLTTAVGDFHALQIPEGEQHIIAAGIPWFATVFGRDSIIAAYQSLSLNPQLAVDTLRVLARYQGKEENDWRDEQPGKILHEYRDGEMTRDGEMPFGPYYGSVDATPLFLVLLSETLNWTPTSSSSRNYYQTPTPRWTGSIATAILTAMASSSICGALRKVWSTRDGRIPGTQMCIAMARSPSRLLRCAKCRATSMTQSSACRHCCATSAT